MDGGIEGGEGVVVGENRESVAFLKFFLLISFEV